MWCHQESNRGHKDFIAALSPLLYQLSYVVIITKKESRFKATLSVVWCHQESNRGHKDFQSFALPTELWHQRF